MKIARAISIALYTIAFMVIGSVIYRALFESGSGRSGGFGYGNLWIRYSIEERGVLDPKLQYLIAAPEMPTNQTYEGAADQFTFSFANGKTFNFHPDSDNLIWIDPMTGITKLPANLTSSLFERIEANRESAKGLTILNGADFLANAMQISAEQAASSNP